MATILQSPGAGVRKALLLLGGAAVSAGVHLVSQLSHSENLPVGEFSRMPEYRQTGIRISRNTNEPQC